MFKVTLDPRSGQQAQGAICAWDRAMASSAGTVSRNRAVPPGGEPSAECLAGRRREGDRLRRRDLGGPGPPPCASGPAARRRRGCSAGVRPAGGHGQGRCSHRARTPGVAPGGVSPGSGVVSALHFSGVERRISTMTTREGKLLRTSIILGAALLLAAPLASFAGSWGVSVGFGVGPSYGYGYAPGPGYVWVPGCYDWRPAYGYSWVPGRWAAPPFAGAFWVGPHWGYYGHHREFIHGYWGHRGGWGHREFRHGRRW